MTSSFSQDDILKNLEQVISSATFANSPQLCDSLKNLVKHKSNTTAGSNISPKEIKKLQRRLTAYYHNEGQNDSIWFDINTKTQEVTFHTSGEIEGIIRRRNTIFYAKIWIVTLLISTIIYLIYLLSSK